MGIKLNRKKSKLFILSFFYRIHKLLPLSNKRKFRLYLNLEWIFDRLAHEMSFKIYSPETHPVRTKSKDFILQKISSESVVLDLGCNLGDIGFVIAEKAKEVVGIDYNAKAIAEANRVYKRENLTFICGEALQYLEKREKKFDTLILSHILEHLDNPDEFLFKFKDYFEWIYIELPDFDKYYLNHYRLDQKLELVYTDSDHVTEFDRYELMDLLEKCQIEIVRSEYIYGLQKLWCKNIPK